MEKEIDAIGPFDPDPVTGRAPCRMKATRNIR